MSIPGIYNAVSSVGEILQNERAQSKPDLKTGLDSDFGKLFQEELSQSEGNLKLSQHAQTRIRSRDIPWGPEVQKRIESGIEVASAKGSREALILADDVAVIANIESKTVVTAMDRGQMSKGKIFTNIDSTVLV